METSARVFDASLQTTVASNPEAGGSRSEVFDLETHYWEIALSESMWISRDSSLRPHLHPRSWQANDFTLTCLLQQTLATLLPYCSRSDPMKS